MDSIQKKKIIKMLERIDRSKTIIAKERDKLRGLHEDLGYLLETVDSGIEAIESGSREIEHGIDKMSETL